MILRRSFAAIGLAMLLASVASAELITEWNYNAYSSPSDASTGTGTTSGSFFPFSSALPNNSGSSADPGTLVIGGTGDCQMGCLNNSNAVRSAPNPGDPSGNNIIEFTTSTGGFTDIAITWDMTAGYRTSRYYQISATTDGSTYSPVSGGVGTGSTTPGVGSATVDTFGLITVIFDDGYAPDPDLDTTTPVDYLFDLSYAFPSGSGFENNPNFGVQIAAIHAPTGNDYVSSFAGTTSADLVSGYLRESETHPRYDLVGVTGVPEPSSLAFAVFGLALAGVLRRR